MKLSPILSALTLIVAAGAAVAATAGLFWSDGGNSYLFSTLHGQTAQISGQGLYRYDTVFFAEGYKGQDAVVLFPGVPLLLFALLIARRGSVSGKMLLTGMLGYILYIYASMALGAAFNRLFLLYVLVFSASMFAFIQAFTSVASEVLTMRIPEQLPGRWLVVFMVASGAITLVVWGMPLVGALTSGGVPDRMDSYTTMVTYALDLGVITPATMLCAMFVLRRNPLGYLIAMPLLVTIILLAPQIILSTIFQNTAGVPFTTPELVGPVSGFVLLGLLSISLLISILRAFSPKNP